MHQPSEVLDSAFIRRGHHTGPYASALGPIETTDRLFELRVIDLLTLKDGRIDGAWVVSDELGLLRQLGAVG